MFLRFTIWFTFVNFWCLFQFTYNQQPVYEGKIAECCKSLPISCWEHCIKEVEIDVNSTYFKMNMNTHEIHRISKVERFVFYEGENISEKIDSLAESGVSHFEEIYWFECCYFYCFCLPISAFDRIIQGTTGQTFVLVYVAGHIYCHVFWTLFLSLSHN